jgi:hypothetical protein
MDVQVNLWGVLLAAVASMAVGSVWYARGVFGGTWMKLVKLDQAKMKDKALPALATAFLLSLLTAYVLAHVSYLSYKFFGGSFLSDSLSTAFWLWLGMVAARIITHDVFEQRRKKLSALTIANELVTLMAMGLVIGWIGF